MAHFTWASRNRRCLPFWMAQSSRAMT